MSVGFKTLREEVRAGLAARTPSPREQQMIDDLMPILLDWQSGRIGDQQMIDLTTATERSTAARYLLWDDDHRDLISRMLDASVNQQVRSGLLLRTPQGLVTKEEVAEHGGWIERGRAVFPQLERKPKPRQVPDVPF